ncbi:MAG TPA: mannosyltransferase family protein [Chloroflexia bacterium]|nr:mannosyltransferase family protein [Chloroflexia bacterium]
MQAKLETRLKTFWRSDKEPLTLWLIWRILLFLLPVAALLILPGLPAILNPYIKVVWVDHTFGTWVRWDGIWYLQIAGQGYASDQLAAFYPLYPFLVRAVAAPFTFNNPSYEVLSIAGVLVSSLAALAAFVFLYRLALMDYDRKTARLSLLYLSAFPMAFFLFAVYTESLFLALAAGAFFAARHNRWFLALVLAALAVLTKNQGIVLVGALLVEFIWQLRGKPVRFDRRLLYFGLPALVFGDWLALNALIYGTPFKFLQVNQTYWKHRFMWPWEAAGTAFDHFLHPTDGSTGTTTWQSADQIQGNLRFLDYPLTLAFVILLIVAIWATWKGYLRLSYLIFFAGCLVLPLTSPIEDFPLLSMPRYMLIIFPAFFLLAQAGKRWPVVHYLYLFFSLPLLIFLSVSFTLWYWIA